MRLLVDTNVVLRFTQAASPRHSLADQALQTLLAQGHEIVLVPQIFYEFWTVATRPESANGLGWSPGKVRQEIDHLTRQFSLIQDIPTLLSIWLDLVTQHSVSGKPAHDARLAAALIAHALDGLLTFNGPDFKRFGIRVLNPADLSSGGPTP